MAKQAKTVTNTLTSDFVVAEPTSKATYGMVRECELLTQQVAYLSVGHQMGNSPWTLCPEAERR
jgi:hypothetical protein